jgi:hypothetical protein
MRPLRGIVEQVLASGRLVVRVENGLRVETSPNDGLTKGDSCWVMYDFTRGQARGVEKPHAWRSATAENAPYEEEIFTGEK